MSLKQKLCTTCKALFKSKDRRVCRACRNTARRAAELQATPTWLTKKQVQEIDEWHTLSKEMRRYYPEVPVVDHIVPLRGRNVCGLNVPWNLQILTFKDNSLKGNKF
jgi:hypothetical protein